MKTPIGKALWLALAMWSIGVTTALAAPALKDGTLRVTRVVAGLASPTTMAFVGPDDILVLQKNDGKVRRVTGGVLQADAVLDVNVDRASERGLLGIALHPDFFSVPAVRSVYLYFTESSTAGDSNGAAAANRVYRYTWDGAALTSPELILDLPVTPGANHDGGIIAFGPDGKLYAVIGDLNRRGQLQNNTGGPAPDDTSVILRVNDDGTTPADNPFAAQGGAVARYFAYGLRNSFGMAFDPVSGALWMTENGPNTFDEINRVDPGFNSGWTRAMGPVANPAGLFSLPGSHYQVPKFSWRDTVGPTGMAFLADAMLGDQYADDLLVGDINNGRLYRFRLNGSRDGFVFSSPELADQVANNSDELDELIFGTGFNGITDVKLGPDGRVYVVSFGNGAIYAISAGPGVATPLIGATSLPMGEVGVPYFADLQIRGGIPPYTVSVVAGALPAGLSVTSDGVAGTPTAPKIGSVTLQVTDQSGASSSKQFAVRIFKAVAVGTAQLPSGRVGERYYTLLKATGGRFPYTWSLVGGTLPAGITLSSTGRLAGTPVAKGSAVLTFQVDDGLGGTARRTLTLTVN